MGQLFGAFGIEWKLLIAQAVNFAIVLAVLYYFLFRPLKRVLVKRQEVIAKGVQEAQEAEEKLKGADAVASEKVNLAETQAEAIVMSARVEAGNEKSQILKDAEARAQALSADAEARAKEQASKALHESEKEIARLAVLAAGKVLADK